MSKYKIFKEGKWYKIKKYHPKWFFGLFGGYWEVLSRECYDNDLVFKTKEQAKEYITELHEDYIRQY